MKRTGKILICMLLVACFCLSALVGCGKEDDSAQTDESQTQSEDVAGRSESTEETVNDVDELKEYDFDGREYRVLTRSSTDYEFCHDSSYGTTEVKNAVFARNEEVKSRFNVQLIFDKENGDWGSGLNQNVWVKKYESVVQSGWSAYELTAAHSSLQQFCAVNGYCYDMSNLETVDMRKEWWSEQFFENCYINGKFYMAVGDIAHTLYEYMQVIFFNETMAENYLKDVTGNPVDLYELVEENEWTWEKLKEYTLKVNFTDEDGEFGLLEWGHSTRGLTVALEMNIMEKTRTENGVIYSFPDVPNEKAQTLCDDIIEFMRSNMGVTYHGSSLLGGRNMWDAFGDGDALFCATSLGYVVNIAERLPVGITYGILPLPLADSDQLEYHTVFRDTLTGVTVPKNVKDTELCGVITEALAMYGYQNVRPSYLNVVLEGRYMANDNLGKMLDLLRETVDIDFMTTYNCCMGTYPYSLLGNMTGATSLKGNYTTYYVEYVSGYREGLKNIYKAFGLNID